MAFLKVYSGDDERTVFLGDEAVVLGRDQSCDVLVLDPKASRQHCIIEPRNGGWRVRDLGSGNGTRLNGSKISEPEMLAPDDVVKIGDVRVLFAGEGAAVVAEPAAERPRRARASAAPPSRSPLLLVGIGVVVVLVALGVWQAMKPSGDKPVSAAEKVAYETVVSATTDRDFVSRADSFLAEYGESEYAAEIRTKADAARDRLRRGKAKRRDGFDPRKGLEGLNTGEAVVKLHKMLDEASADKRGAIREALAEYEERLGREREGFFKQIETVFREQVEKGQFARAREMWFFLVDQEGWTPVPPPFPDRIVDANAELENAASAARTALLEKCSRSEAAYDFKGAIALLDRNLPRFRGTSVYRSLEERREFYVKALKQGVRRKPITPTATVRLDVGKKMAALLQGLANRDFRGAATQLRTLADAAKKAKDRGYPVLAARTREVESAAALHDALVAALASGKAPKKQIARKWRVVSGGKPGVKVRSGGKELDYPWTEAPATLYLALLAGHADTVKHGKLGLVVAAHALGGDNEAIRVVGELGEKHPKSVDRFLAERMRDEPVPEGGYLVHEGKLFTRKEYLRKQEEARIQALQAQLDKAYETVKNDKAFARIDKLRKRKDHLDKARAFALELIFDEKKYFYPYRGTGRMAEYNTVQQEVDARVAAVREIWDDRTNVKIGLSNDLKKALKLFDDAVVELEKRLVDVEDKVDEIAFLRSYLGQKFTVRTLFRDYEEWQLLRYSQEVMEWNPTVKGNILPQEYEQVRVTNEYRMMFGRWPVRIHEKLVLSSRGHCEEMSRLGYFGHFSPTPGRRTPYDRMRLAGYIYGASENCSMGRGDPAGAHYGWCHSSGHHRNLLMPPWTELGSGVSGRYWTQNFGQAPKWSKHDPKEDEEDESYREWEDEDAEIEDGDDDDDFDYGDGDEE